MNSYLSFIRNTSFVIISSALLASCGQSDKNISSDQSRSDAQSSTNWQSGLDWPWYHGNPHGTHYSTLDQINKYNVKDLQVAWTFDSGDAFGEGGSQSDMQSNPRIINGDFYFVSPKGRLIPSCIGHSRRSVCAIANNACASKTICSPAFNRKHANYTHTSRK